jgi:hypothetical protein
MSANPNLKRGWLRVVKLAFVALTILVAIAWVFVRFIVLDEQQLKEKASKSISAHFMRDDTEIGSIDVGLFSGTLTLKNIKIKERYDVHGKYPDFLTASEVHVTFDRLAFIRSGFRKFKNLDIVAVRPELIVERAQDNACNIDDLKLAIQKLDIRRFVDLDTCSLEIQNGSIKTVRSGNERDTRNINMSLDAETIAEHAKWVAHELSALDCPCLR